MGRPSLKHERTNQILDAAETCVVKFGFGGLTLEKVAEVAQLARPLIRHNIGNREDIINALVARFLAKSKEYTKNYIDQLPSDRPLSALIELFFEPQYSDSAYIAIAGALLAEGGENKAIGKKMRAWTTDFIKEVYRIAEKQYPDADPQKLRDIVVGINGLFFSVESTLLSGEIKDYRNSSRRAAHLLTSTLELKAK